MTEQDGPPPIKDSGDEWYYVDNGTRKGPISASEIQDLLKQKKLDGDDQIWRKGMKEWSSVRNSELSALVESEPPPVSGQHIGNSLVWIIAMVPLAVGLIDASLASDPSVVLAKGIAPYVGKSVQAPHVPWTVPVAIYTLLGLWDEHRLKKAGHSSKWMTGFAALLTPIYLFMRAKKLKQRPTYAITWVALFVFSLLLVASTEPDLPNPGSFWSGFN